LDAAMAFLTQNITGIIHLDAGDYVELCAYHDSGTDRVLTQQGADISHVFQVHLLTQD
jgi:hypothetical protein